MGNSSGSNGWEHTPEIRLCTACEREVGPNEGVVFHPRPVGEELTTNTEYAHLEKVCLCNQCLRRDSTRRDSFVDAAQSQRQPEKRDPRVSAETREHQDDNLQNPPATSEKWWYGIVIGILLTIPGVVITSTLTIVGVIFAWIIIPISGYYDIEYVRANSDWDPDTTRWIVGMILPVVNGIVPFLYLYHRRKVLGVP